MQTVKYLDELIQKYENVLQNDLIRGREGQSGKDGSKKIEKPVSVRM